MVLYRTRNSLISHSWQIRGSPNGTDDDHGLATTEEEGRASSVRGRIEGLYQDDPSPEGDRPEDNSGPDGGAKHLVVQPSRLHNEGNEWREI